MRSFICSMCVLLVIVAAAQAQTPTVSPISAQWWSRTGNIAPPNNGNVIGTFFSSPFYLYTDSFLRMRINKNLTTGVNSLPAVARNGYVGIGNDLGGIWSTQNPGPFSLLHLNGSGTFVQQFGYRNWMQTGITFTSNNDFAYIGQKQNTPAGQNILDITDFVVAWGDNATSGTVGPDVMKFVFTSGTGSSNTDLNGDHPDGREIMRLTGFGNVGIGPRFNNTPAAQPQAMLHINSPNNDDATLQMTTQNAGQQSVNGLLMKVSGANRDVWFSQQEDANMLFFTGTNFGNGGERMRLSTTGAGNPALLPANLTRIGISHSPGSVIHPLSLLHLGYDTTGTQHNGWRPWMDVGTFTAMGSDDMYVGLKIEPPNIGNLAGDRHDAVIAWGDNTNPNPPASGPDYLRFIFAATPSDVRPPRRIA